MGNRALLFSGQGAQFVGMGRDLAETYPVSRELFERADEVLGYSLSKTCFEGPEEALTRSDHCQPAIFVTSMACRAALSSERPDLEFVACAGLSLGEWTALHMAGALSFEDTLKVLEARGRFMQEACEEQEGGMVSVIGLPEAKVREIAAAAGAEVANLNSPEQTVLAGSKTAVAEAERMSNEAGAKRAIVLKVAGAFHSSLMRSAADRLKPVLEQIEIKAPSLPVAANFTGGRHGGPDDIRRDMLGQITGSVRWYDCVRWLREQHVETFVECGPGRVLTGLVKRIDREAGLYNVQDCETLKKTAQAI